MTDAPGSRASNIACAGTLPPGLLAPGELAVDVGANIGEVTAQFLSLGARVHAFEPHPAAFAALERRFAGNDAVTLHAAALTDREGRRPLYMHRSSEADPLKWSVGSSVLADKSNVNPLDSVPVTAMDAAGFLRSLGEPIAVMKIDAEGAEAMILRRLLDDGSFALVRTFLVELHERKVPSIDEEIRRIREQVGSLPGVDVRFDWR